MEHSRRIGLIVTLLWAAVSVLLAVSGCGGDEDGDDGSNGIIRPKPDTIPPATVTDLRIKAPSITTLAVVWTSPGDDATSGTAMRYDIRFSSAPITAANWDQATSLNDNEVPAPKPGGQVETIVVEGLGPGTTYYFALKTADEVPNWSEVSNSAGETTLGEADPPAEVTDLSAVALDITSFELVFTAPGDDGNEGQASGYDIRYSILPIEDETSWHTASRVPDVPPPGPPGQEERITVTGLGNSDGYFFVLKTVDDNGNWSGMSNTAIGMKFGVSFWLFPNNVTRGEYLYVVFETSTADTLTLTTNGMYVPRICNVGVIEELMRDAFPDGVHVLVYDFVNQSTGQYYSPDYYWIALCRGQESLEAKSVELR